MRPKTGALGGLLARIKVSIVGGSLGRKEFIHDEKWDNIPGI